jgi:pyrimidine-nucleoside phosphorylase
MAILSDMNQPLGEAVGNALELKEALETLHDKGPADFREHVLVTSGYMLALGGVAIDEKQGKALAIEALASGKSLKKFRQLVIAQGGDASYVDDPSKLVKARLVQDVKSTLSGYLQEVNARKIGEATVLLGGGRERKGDPIDHAVGIIVKHKVGDYINVGDVLFTIHANAEARGISAKEMVLKALKWSATPVKPLPLYYGTIS